MTILTIADNEEFLRSKCETITFPLSSEDLKWVDRLKAELKYLGPKAAGVAAPQIGWNKRVFVTHTGIFFNPIYDLIMACPMKLDFEACLSIPGRTFLVNRPIAVMYSYQDSDGKRHMGTLKDFLARVYMHEVDHLSGRLIDAIGIGVKDGILDR